MPPDRLLHQIISRVRRLHIGERISAVRRTGDVHTVMPPLIVQGPGSTGGHVERNTVAWHGRAALGLNGDGRGDETVDPSLKSCDGIRVDGVAGQRRHFVGPRRVQPDVHDRFGNVRRHDHLRAGDAECVAHGTVDDVLIRQRSIETGIIIGLHTAIGPVALGAVGIQVGAHARLQ
jgi:hypothetical protein